MGPILLFFIIISHLLLFVLDRFGSCFLCVLEIPQQRDNNQNKRIRRFGWRYEESMKVNSVTLKRNQGNLQGGARKNSDDNDYAILKFREENGWIYSGVVFETRGRRSSQSGTGKPFTSFPVFCVGRLSLSIITTTPMPSCGKLQIFLEHTDNKP